MELILLAVPDCPNAAVLEERLAAVLAGHPEIVVRRREVSDEQAAVQAGMHGSPTLLVNGADPFAPPGRAPSLSCRLYRDTAGRPVPAPSVRALREALEAAGMAELATAGQAPSARLADEHAEAACAHGHAPVPQVPGSRATGKASAGHAGDGFRS